MNVFLGAVCAAFFSVSIVTINGFQASSVLLAPFAPRAFRAVNRWFANTWWSWIVVWFRSVAGIETVFSGDEPRDDENTLVICNHQSMADIPVLFALGWRAGRLGDMKWFAKDVLKFVPGVGWGMFFLDCVFLKRDWAADQSRVETTFARLREHKVRFWLVSFVEGTRVTTAKLAASQEFARKKGLPVLAHTLIPRAKGFAASMQGLRSEIGAVYDITIGYEGGVPTLWQYMCGKSRRVHIHLSRHGVETLPTGEAELGRWLLERYVEKDARLGRFLEAGRFSRS